MKKHNGASASRKSAERVAARRLAGQRSPNTGGATAAGLSNRLAVAVKPRSMRPAWLLDAVAQPQRNAPADRLPVVVRHQATTRHYLALMPRAVLESQLQEAPPPTQI